MEDEAAITKVSWDAQYQYWIPQISLVFPNCIWQMIMPHERNIWWDLLKGDQCIMPSLICNGWVNGLTIKFHLKVANGSWLCVAKVHNSSNNVVKCINNITFHLCDHSSGKSINLWHFFQHYVTWLKCFSSYPTRIPSSCHRRCNVRGGNQDLYW